MFTLYLNNTDFSNYVKMGGVEWSRNDIDGSNAGRDMSGNMIRDYIVSKDKLKITCRPLTTQELTQIADATKTRTIVTRTQLGDMSYSEKTTCGIAVGYTSPETGSVVSKTMYCSTFNSGFLLNRGSNDLWSGVSFNLIEV